MGGLHGAESTRGGIRCQGRPPTNPKPIAERILRMTSPDVYAATRSALKDDEPLHNRILSQIFEGFRIPAAPRRGEVRFSSAVPITPQILDQKRMVERTCFGLNRLERNSITLTIDERRQTVTTHGPTGVANADGGWSRGQELAKLEAEGQCARRKLYA